MMPHDLTSLIPRNKSDIARAKCISKLGFPAIEPILPDILEWTQDYNWPVAQALNDLLCSIGAPLAPYVRPILDGDDDTWKYFVITSIVKSSPELARSLKAELTRIAYTPTIGEEKEEAAEVAREALAELATQ
jgi:hypothetical protein